MKKRVRYSVLNFWKNDLIILFFLFLLAVGWRLWPGNYSVIFPYDQARDALFIKHVIANRDLPLLGPVSDINGVHHGPWFYYFLLPLYWIGNFNPTILLIGMVTIVSLTIFPIFFLATVLFDKKTAYIATILFIFSFETTSYARWLSNPVLAIPLMSLFLICLWFSGKKRWTSFGVGFFYGLLVGVQLVLAHLLIAWVTFFVLRKSTWREYVVSFLGTCLALFPLLLAELKFHFQSTRGLLKFVLTQSGDSSLQVNTALLQMVDMTGELLRNNMFGATTTVAFILGTILAFSLYRSRKLLSSGQIQALLMLITVFASYGSLLTIGKVPMNFFFVGAAIPLLLIAAFGIRRIWEKTNVFIAFGILLCIGISQIKLFIDQTQDHGGYVQIQEGMWLSDRMRVIDVIYQKVGNKTPFSLSIFQTPYGIRSAWAYYFWLYSQDHSVHLPLWYGYAANGYIGDDVLVHTDAPKEMHITVYEPRFDIPAQFETEFTVYQNQHTQIVSEFEISHHKIQLRRPLDKVKKGN